MNVFSAKVSALTHKGSAQTQNADTVHLNGRTLSKEEAGRGMALHAGTGNSFAVAACFAHGNTKAYEPGALMAQAVDEWREKTIVNRDESDTRTFADTIADCYAQAGDLVARFNQARRESAQASMTLLAARDQELLIAHAGDMRVYIFSRDVLRPLFQSGKTQDNPLEPEIFIAQNLHDHDLFLLCNAALASLLDEREITRLLQESIRDSIADFPTAEQAASVLLKAAHAKDNRQTLSILVMEINKREEATPNVAGSLHTSAPSMGQKLLPIAALAAVLLIAGVLITLFMQNRSKPKVQDSTAGITLADYSDSQATQSSLPEYSVSDSGAAASGSGGYTNVPSTYGQTVTNAQTSESATARSSTTQPTNTQPTATRQPSTTEPTTGEEQTTQPSTAQPTTTQPIGTQPSTTQPPTTVTPITQNTTEVP